MLPPLPSHRIRNTALTPLVGTLSTHRNSHTTSTHPILAQLWTTNPYRSALLYLSSHRLVNHTWARPPTIEPAQQPASDKPPAPNQQSTITSPWQNKWTVESRAHKVILCSTDTAEAECSGIKGSQGNPVQHRHRRSVTQWNQGLTRQSCAAPTPQKHNAVESDTQQGYRNPDTVFAPQKNQWSRGLTKVVLRILCSANTMIHDDQTSG
jgi:hypothetical protein